jgi:hypothetical protein
VSDSDDEMEPQKVVKGGNVRASLTQISLAGA